MESFSYLERMNDCSWGSTDTSWRTSGPAHQRSRILVTMNATQGYHWQIGNPTGKTLAEVAPLYLRGGSRFDHDRFVELVEDFEDDRRVSFRSVIPVSGRLYKEI